MILVGNRLLVSKIEDDKKEGFEAVEVQDSFVYKGVVQQVGECKNFSFKEEMIVLFSKYSPDTQEVDVLGVKMKIINADDVLAIL